MGEIDILRLHALDRCDTEHIGHCHESMGTDENAAPTKKSIFAQTPDNAKVLRQHGFAAQCDGRCSETLNWLGLMLAMIFD